MAAFFDLYDSFDAFYESFFRGNEIEFLYKKDTYTLFPIYDKNDVVIAINFSRGNRDEESIIKSSKDLYEIQLNNNSLGTILNEIDVIWYNI